MKELTADQTAAMEFYSSLMMEVRLRIAAIDKGTTNLLGTLEPIFVQDFCFLQLRLICELVALGCLVAHGDITITKKLKKEWAADKIIGEMEKLKPEFFPLRCSLERAPDKRVTNLMGREAEQMTKAEMISLYTECNGKLHKGNLKNLLKARMPIQVRYPDITARAQKLRDLLSVHMMALDGGERMLICTMYVGDKVQTASAARSEPPPPLESQNGP